MEQVPEPVRATAAASFAVDAASLHWIGGTDGSVYSVRKGSRAHVLKIAPIPAEDLPRHEELHVFKRYLADHDVPIAMPLPSEAGRALETIIHEGQTYLVTLMLRADGQAPSARNAYLWNADLFTVWGRVMGRMHALAKRYPHWQREDGGTALGDFRTEHPFFAGWSVDAEVVWRWQRLLPALEALPIDRAGYGLIHNDLHNDNFFYNPQARSGWPITILDFDVAAYFWYINDIAIALYHAVAWWGRDRAARRANARVFLDAFMNGYNHENTLDDIWFEQLPLFLRYRDVVLHTAMSHEWPHGKRQPWQSKALSDMRQRIIEGESLV